MLHTKGINFYSKLDSLPMPMLSWYLNYVAWRMIYYTVFKNYPRILDWFHDLSCLITTFCLSWSLATRYVKGYPFSNTELLYIVCFVSNV